MIDVPGVAGSPRRAFFAPTLKAVPNVAGLGFCGLILWALLNNLVNPSYGTSWYHPGWAAFTSTVMLVSMVAFHWLLQRIRGIFRKRRLLSGITQALLWPAIFVLLVRLSYATRIHPDWDAYSIYHAAEGLALGSTETIDPGYFRLNPNNLLLTLVLWKYFRAARALGFADLNVAAAFFNAVVLFLGIALTYSAARMLGGPVLAGFTLFPSTVFVLFSPWIGVVYSDTAGLVFPIGLLCLFLAARRTQGWGLRVLLWILIGLTSSAGYGIKPTILICVVAAGMVALFSGRGEPQKQRVGHILLAGMVISGSFGAGNHLIGHWEQHSGAVGYDMDNNTAAMPFTHFLQVGSQRAAGPHGDDYYGSYNEADYLATVSIEDPQEKFQHGFDAYFDRVDAMGPAGYLNFLNNKLLWITGDGSFFTWGEGRMTGSDYIATDPVSNGIQDFFGEGRIHFDVMITLWQGTWLAVLALVALPLVYRRKSMFTTETAILRISLLGLLVFLLLFEARARFLYLYVPYFILLAAVTVQSLAAGRQAAAHAGAESMAEVIQ